MNSLNSPTDPPARPGSLKIVARIGLPLLVLAIGAGVAYVLLKTPPKAQRKAPARQARLVEVQPVRFSRQSTVIQTMGVVQPAREVVLYPRVAGEIVSVSDQFEPGARFLEDQVMVQIDPADFRLAVQQRESDLAQAQGALALELGQQSVAKREYELLGESIAEEDRDLVLRQPQLEQVRARVKAAEAALEQAKLNLERATVKAPFNATVRTRNVNVGAQVTPATAMATLAGNDEYWVEVTVPVDQLQWIHIPGRNGDSGSVAHVFSGMARGTNDFRDGRVLRLLPDLEKDGRMARLLVAVTDPLALTPATTGKPALILGDYVRVELDGLDLESVAAVDRSLFRDGDALWIMNAENRLEIRPVEVAFRGRDQLLVRSGVKDGERLVTSDLAAAVDGMLLRTQDDVPPVAVGTEGKAGAGSGGGGSQP